MDRLLTRGYPDGGVEQFAYSARGLILYTNQLTNVTAYGYDAALRKLVETNANQEITQYSYSPAGDLLSLTDAQGLITSWNYDMFGRATNKIDATSTLILKYSYDPDSRLTNRWGIAKSNTIRSGFSFFACSIASTPSAASPHTSNPSRSKKMRMMSRTESPSSITNILGVRTVAFTEAPEAAAF